MRMVFLAKNLKLIIISIYFIIISMINLPTDQSQVIHPDCEESCGNLNIPYPFGTKEGCFLNLSFRIICNYTFIPPKPTWGLGSSQQVEVVNISIDVAQMRILTGIASECYMSNGTTNSSYSGSNFTIISTRPSFPLSHTRNRFFGVGCNNDARFRDLDRVLGCSSSCYENYNPTDGDCTGVGCCYIPIPKGIYIYSVGVNNYTFRTASDFSLCSFSFLAADDFYNFSVADLRSYDLRGTNLVPSILDWSVGNQTCEEALKDSTTYLCSTNSFCRNPDNDWKGYLCYCSPGYRGNPYLPNGCQDVNECMELSHECVKLSECVNTEGGYNCSCPKGYRGDGKQNGERCTDIDECDDPELNDCDGLCSNKPGSYSCSSQNSSAINVAVGIGVAMVVAITGGTFLFWSLRKRKLIKLKEKFFEQNGGFLLQQLVEQKELTSHMIKIFTAEELQTATKNYSDSLIAGRGGYGTVYKGTLTDGSLVAIKKSKQTDVDIDEAQVKQFISEVVVLCQVNNRNIVRMLGCCLETPSPILVYEFVSNGTLYEHLHDKEGKYLSRGTISWETRLKIATQTAGVLSYLHFQAVTPIIHRDIKSTNILLDENFNAMVSDFGASKLIASDEMQVYTIVQGTLGYLDPEYLQTSQLTEKSDVYSFGVLLVELLTGQKAIRFNKSEAERSLAMYFLCALKENRLVEVLEPRVVEEGSVESLQAVADIAKLCLSLKGDERPNMKQVAVQLEGLRNMGVGRHFSPWNGEELHSEEETVYLMYEDTDNYDSNRNQVLITIPANGR